MFKTQFYYFFILTLTYSIANGSDDYMKKRPPWLNECRLSDPDKEFIKCSTSSAQNFFVELSKGIPELKSIRPIDPFRASKIKIDQSNSQAVSLKADLKDLTLTGFAKTRVKECKVNKKDFSWLTHYVLPKVVIHSNYDIDGRILVLPIRGKGKLYIELDNVDITMRTKNKIYHKYDLAFYNVTSNKVDLSTAGMKIRLDNLFNGNKELEDSTNQFFNENWRDVFEAMKPIIGSIIEEIMLDILQKAFNYIPASYWIIDIPKST